jgi:hypothetical protein
MNCIEPIAAAVGQERPAIMPNKIDQFEAVFGAIARITSGDEDPALADARCPKCRASDFMQVIDAFYEAVGQIEASPEAAGTVLVAGMTNEQIVKKFAPPQRRSPLITPILVAIPLAIIAVVVRNRFGSDPGLFTAVGGGVIVLGVLLTSLRKSSDQYYAARQIWRKLYLCRKCGQLVAS